MTPSNGIIDIGAKTQKLEVDHRISLRIYFRIADNLLRQANIFRNEKNVIDLYVMLLRFSSLVSETIPRHREYVASPPGKKSLLKKQLLVTLNELESLNPTVKQKLQELARKPAYQAIGWNYSDCPDENLSLSSSVQWPLVNARSPTNKIVKTTQNFSSSVYGGSNAQTKLYTIPVEDRFNRLSVSIPRPTEEALSRHSILGANGLCRQWQPPVSNTVVRYPSNIDTTPVEIPRLQQVMVNEDGVAARKDISNLDREKPSFQPTLEPGSENQKPKDDEQPMISFETSDVSDSVVKQPNPPAVLAEVLDLIPAEPHLTTEKGDTVETPLQDNLLKQESPMELHVLKVTVRGQTRAIKTSSIMSCTLCLGFKPILPRCVLCLLNSVPALKKSTSMMDTFLRLAKSNTSKNLETCGILAGSLKNRKFYITALIIPKQESTSDTCQATNEEEIFEVQDKRSLFPLGWIHTHPSQSCFMSSVDLHTHYSYQVMLPEAVAIVMAPKDRTKTHGIFRLTTPGGMSVIRYCERRGFHSHEQPADGGPIYKQCTDVYMNPNLKFDVIDLR